MSLLQTVTDAKFVVVVYAVDSNAEQIAVAFEPNGKGDYINTRLTSLFLSSSYGKNNYIRNNIKKHVVDIKYAKDDLSQVNPQLYEWLAIINDKSSYDDRLPQNSYKSNPSQQNNSDSGKEFNDPNGRYSKDDTIFDDFEDEEVMFTADGDIAFDGFGADAQRTIDVKEMVQEQGAEHAVYTLYNAAAHSPSNPTFSLKCFIYTKRRCEETKLKASDFTVPLFCSSYVEKC